MNFEELEKRIHFLNQQVDVLFKRVWEVDKDLSHWEKMTLKCEIELERFEERAQDLRREVRQYCKARTNKRLRLIQKNLQSVTRQLKERDPKAYIPEGQMEAFQEFLIKLKKNGQR